MSAREKKGGVAYGPPGNRDGDVENTTGPTAPGTTSYAGDRRRGLLSPGARVGEYLVCQMIDRGGCGIVYSGRHARTGESVAIKVLRSELLGSSHMIERFVGEARAIDAVRHSNIVRIHDGGMLSDGRPFLVMELLQGTSLRQLREQRGAFSPDEVLEVMAPICAALEAVHAAGYIHRDLKSSNVIVSDDRARVTLLDFGIAKLVRPAAPQSGLTSVGHPMGTPHAMAPEQILGGEVDRSTDVYALGILTYELLTASLPFMSDSRAEIERMHLRAEPPRPSREAPVSAAVDEVVLRCLAKAQRDRYQSPVEFVRALCAAIHSDLPARPAETSVEADAIGIFVEIQPSSSGYDELDDAVLDALMDVLDVAESEFGSAGFAVPIQTSNSLLGVVIMPGETGAANAVRRDALATAHRLHRALSEVDGVGQSLRLRLTVHRDRVAVSGEDRRTLVSGPLLRITEWPAAEGDEVRVTPRMGECLAAEPGDPR